MRSMTRRAGVPAFFLLLLGAAPAAAEPASARPLGGRSIQLGGTYRGPNVADVDVRGRAIVRAHAPSAVLVTSGVDAFGDGETIVRYGQSHLGLPVIGRGAAVRLSPSGQPMTTVLDLASDLPARRDAAITPAGAARIASSRFAVGASERDAHLVVWPTRDRGARLAYAVVPRVPAGIPTAPRAIVDAETGEVIEARDTLVFASAQMFEQNPKKTPGLGLRELALAPEGSGLSNPFVTATNCIDKKTVKPVSFIGIDLDVHVCDLEQVASADGDGNYVYAPSDEAGSAEAREDAFSEVSIYYHAAKAYAFFRGLQGDGAAQVVADKPLRLVANLQIPAGLMSGDLKTAADPDVPLDTFQNAFFSPAGGGLGSLFQQLYGIDSGALWFGQGPTRDYAYDGDVVYHEFTHAVVDATLKLGAWHLDARGAVDAPGAMNEGLADYFSSAITGDPDVGEYASVDLGGTQTAIRTLANDDRCPTAILGEVHADSTLFSGALWTARTSLPEADRAAFDRALYKAMRANAGREDLGYEDLAELFLATLKTDHPAGQAALEAAMKDRGILPACERVVPLDGEAVKSPDPRIGFVAPGKQTLGVKHVAPGVIQVRAALPGPTSSVDVSFVARSGGGLGSLGGNAKPFAPVVLAKLGKPITWEPGSKTGHDADLTATVKSASGRVSATLTIPEGSVADSIYVQIANNGDSDGAYDTIVVTSTPRATEEPPPEDEGAPAPSAPPAPAVDDSGCSASGAAGPAASARLLPGLAMAFAGLAALRRRRRRSR